MHNPLPTAALLLLAAACSSSPTPPPPLVNEVLIFTKTAGFRHTSIPTGIATLEALAREAGLMPRATEDAAAFTDTGLANVATVVFLSTTDDVLGPDQEAALERYVRAGGGFLGIHAAADTEYEWPFYTQLVGAQFDSHPKIQSAAVRRTSARSPTTDFLPEPWTRTDEWYNFKNVQPNLTVLLELDESTYEGGTNAPSHPAAWLHRIDRGRAYYTAGGHTQASFTEPLFRRHLAAALRYAAGRETMPKGTPESH